jgi:hypothetical protein
MDKFEKVLDMIDHQDKYSDEEISEILHDDECRKLYQTMQEVESALLDRDIKMNVSDDGLAPMVDIDKEWREFEETHQCKSGSIFSWHKMAASFVGLLVVSSIAVAAIHIIDTKSHNSGSTLPEAANKELVMNDSTLQKVPGDSLQQNKTVKPAIRKTFENVPIDKMISEIAAYYDMQVRFDNADAKSLRLYYEWDSRLGIGNTIKELNQFENVNIEIERQTVVVK